MLGFSPLNTAPLNSLGDAPVDHMLSGSVVGSFSGSVALILGLTLTPTPAQAVFSGSTDLSVFLNQAFAGSAVAQFQGSTVLDVSFPNGAFRPAILAEMQTMNGAQPVNLLRVEFDSGDTFIGESDFTISNWAGSNRSIRGWIQSLGRLDDVADFNPGSTPVLSGDLLTQLLVPGGREGADTIWSRLVDPDNSPEQTTVSLYMWFRNLNALIDPPVKVWEGTFRNWRWVDEITLEVDFANALERPDHEIGRFVNTDNFPNADPDDIGKMESIWYGNVKGSPCLAIDAGPNSPLAFDATAVQIFLYYSNTATNFSASGSVFIDSEELGYASVDTEVLNGITVGKLIGVTRGLNSTIAVDHTKGSAMVQAQTSYTYIVASHPMKSVSEVFVESADGKPVLQPGGSYSVNLNDTSFPDGLARTTISFNVLPKLVRQVTLDIQDQIGVVDNLSISQSPGSHTSTNTVATTQLATTPLPSTVEYIALNCSGGGEKNIINFPPLPPGTFVSQIFRLGANLVQQGICGGFTRNFRFKVPGGASTGAFPVGISITSEIQDFTGQNSLNVISEQGFPFSGAANGVFIVMSASRTVITLQSPATSANLIPGVSKAAPAVKTGTVAVSGNTAADTVIGGLVTVNGQGYTDDTLGTFTGVPNALIQRSAHVIKHFLATYLGTNPVDFRTSIELSNKMGSTYQLNGVIQEPDTVVRLASRMAFESQCWLKFQGRFPSLIFRERLFPPHHIITTKTMAFLRGSRQSADVQRMPKNWIVNKLDLRYDRDLRFGQTFDAYRQVKTVQNPRSITKFGERAQPELFQCRFVNTDDHAQAISQFYLDLYSWRRAMIRFRTFLQHANVQFGQRLKLQDRMAPYEIGEVVSADYSPGNGAQGRMPFFDFTVMTIEEALAMWNRISKTTDYTLKTPEDQWTVFDNEGAVALVTLTLPPAIVGMRYLISVHDAQELRLQPDGTDLFILDFTSGSATDKVSPDPQAASKYLSASATRSYLMVASLATGEWTTIGHTGAWTIEA